MGSDSYAKKCRDYCSQKFQHANSHHGQAKGSILEALVCVPSQSNCQKWKNETTDNKFKLGRTAKI